MACPVHNPLLTGKEAFVLFNKWAWSQGYKKKVVGDNAWSNGSGKLVRLVSANQQGLVIYVEANKKRILLPLADAAMLGAGATRNPLFLPKSLFDSYTVKSSGGEVTVEKIQTVAGAERKVRELARKYPCVGFEIRSRKFGSVVKAYAPAMRGSAALKVVTDNTREYKREATDAAKDAAKFVLYVDGKEFATYDTRKEAETAGKGEGGRVRVKSAVENPCNPSWAFLGLRSTPPTPITRRYVDDGDVYEERITPQYYHVRVRSNVTYEDKGGTEGYYVSNASKHAVTRELEKKMHFNADWDVIATEHRATKEDVLVKRQFENPAAKLDYVVTYFYANGTRNREYFTRKADAERRLRLYQRNHKGGHGEITTEPHLTISQRQFGVRQNPGQEYIDLGGACDDCVIAIANDDYTGMDDVREAATRGGIHKYASQGKYLVVGDELGFESSRCVICGGLAGNRHEVGYLQPSSATRNPTADRIEPGTLPKVHYSMGQSNAALNRSLAMRALKGGMTPAEIHQEWSRIWSLSSDGKIAQIYDSEFAAHPGVYETKYAMTGVKEAIAKYKRARGRKRNPEGDTTDTDAFYETFHGEPPTETLEVYTEEFERTDLTTLGYLIQLKVETTTGKLAELNAPDPETASSVEVVRLACSPDGKSLYLVGGDQDVPCETLGFTEKDDRDNMVLGLVCEITYRTRKAFDRFEEIDYYHETGEETKVRTIADEFRRKPTLLYCPQDQTMRLAGGMYEVKDVGIVN